MIVIPTYNERKNIRELAARIRKVLPNAPILFVDDDSPDGTGSEIEDLMRSDSLVRLIKRNGKGGLGSAYREGFKQALQDNSSEYVVEMDADLSHHPEALPELLAALREHDVVVGSRYVKGGRIENWGWSRRMISRLGNLYARFIVGIGVSDLTAGFVAYRKQALKLLDLDEIKSDGYAFQIEMKYRLAEQGAKIAEVPIVFSERREGESKFSSGIFGEGVRLPWQLLRRKVAENPATVAGGLLVFLAPLLVYGLTSPDTIYLGDSPEFAMAVETLGIPHPPGYPSYMVLAKLFSFFVWGSTAFRLALFSAFCASLGLFFVYLTCLRLFSGNGRRSLSAVLAAAAAPLLIAFTDIFWSQAIMAKMYQLHFLVVAILIWIAVKYFERPKAKHVLWAAFLFGLGFGAHQMILFFVPVFILAFLVKRLSCEEARYILNPVVTKKIVLAALALGIAGLGFYAYLPIRSSMEPLYQWGDSSTFNAFMTHVTRSEYSDLGQSFNWKYKAEFIVSFFRNTTAQFKALLLLAIPGLAWLFVRRRNFALLSLSIFALNTLGIILTRSLPWTFDGQAYSSFYYLPAYAITGIWITAGFSRLFSTGLIKFSSVALIAFLVAAPSYFLYNNYARNNLYSFTFLEDYSRKLLESLEPNAVLIVSYDGVVNDSMVFGLFYQQKVNGVRTDVKIADSGDIYPNVDREVLTRVYDLDKLKNFRTLLVRYLSKQPSYQNRPIYTTYPVDNLEIGWHSQSNGLAYRFGGTAPLPLVDFSPKDSDVDVLERSYFGRDLLAQYYYVRATGLLDSGDKGAAEKMFILAINNDNEVVSEDSLGFMAHRMKKNNLKK